MGVTRSTHAASRPTPSPSAGSVPRACTLSSSSRLAGTAHKGGGAAQQGVAVLIYGFCTLCAEVADQVSGANDQ